MGVNTEKYLVNGKVKRSRIVTDIQYLQINKSDIDSIVSNKNVKAEFFGKMGGLKTDKSNWDERYLEKLANASVGEVFNEEYLYYLYDVSKYVNSIKKDTLNDSSTKIIIGATIGILLLASICGIVANKSNNEKKNSFKIATQSELK